jgi:hypothetical protein
MSKTQAATAPKITSDNIKEFKRLYNKAVKNGNTEFDFHGWPVLVLYAEYLIEYLEMQTKV